MKYEENIWYGWNGGECPVHPETVVEVVCTNSIGTVMKITRAAGVNDWEVGTHAFRVIKEHKPAREFWCVLQHMMDTKEEAEAHLAALNREHPGLDFGKVFHVKEQQE